MTKAQARLLLSSAHPCSYLEGRSARSLFVDPGLPLDEHRYGQLLEVGFRRSGGFVYRPACRECQECQPARVPVADFRPDRSQRRCLARNADVTVTVRRELDEEHFALYGRYLNARHGDGGMKPDDSDTFYSFLTSGWGHTELLELRDATGRLLAGAVTDRIPHGLSAVYTWFDPDQESRSLGTLGVLMQIRRAEALGVPYVYLGYWVPGSKTMDYKRRFRPLEVLKTGGWQPAE